ncbi:MAG: 16S rRNA (cytosine(1402)-N(4))-methyltransferase RsmH [Planctomycetota bacterium]|nr:16S rRNA (cytosine(1402)-N(4))-methyltransferase RsmH [Planctomycetota bacterium]
MDDAGHLPVLLDEALRLLAPAGKQVIVDCTVGLGGHAEALLESAGGDATLIGIDLDGSNLLKTKERLMRFGLRVRLFEADFADLDAVMDEAGVTSADVVLADLGMASTQVDDPSRGFSFQSDGPLDMRYSRSGRTAAEMVNTLGESELADLIYRYGEDRHSRRIARSIVRARQAGRIERTEQLARIVALAMPRKTGARWKIHPATRTFQALRVAVNGELESLQRLLEKIPGLLSVGGRAAVISFHSLEDRLIKRAFAAAARTGTYRLLNKKPITAGNSEIQRNPRSRSSKIRAIERIH